MLTQLIINVNVTLNGHFVVPFGKVANRKSPFLGVFHFINKKSDSQ